MSIPQPLHPQTPQSLDSSYTSTSWLSILNLPLFEHLHVAVSVLEHEYPLCLDEDRPCWRILKCSSSIPDANGYYKLGQVMTTIYFCRHSVYSCTVSCLHFSFEFDKFRLYFFEYYFICIYAIINYSF